MSIILDALRKSENSRLRQDHPAIFAARAAPTRSRLPIWALVLVALLAINFLVIAWALLRSEGRSRDPSRAEPLAAVIVATPTPAAPSAAAPAPAAIAPAEIAPATLASTTARTAVAAPAPAAAALPRPPSRDDLLARGSTIPPVELNMHVYDPNPQARFVLLNGQRLREGESSREGLVIERITAEGVILRFGNSTFAVNLQ
jgi:general secretion pathway protein B